jgi:putative ABC transport system substrate-binding protein
MQRREFLGALGGAAASLPRPARAQQAPKVARIGFLGLASASSHAHRTEALRRGMRDLGYVEGKNLAIEFRWAEGRYERLPELAQELVRLNLDVILTHTVPGALAVSGATKTIPIVITAASDLLSVGLVSNLSRPGGNLTGLTFFNAELAAKRLEFLKEAIPSLTRAAVILNPDNAVGGKLIIDGMQATSSALNVALLPIVGRGLDDLNGIFALMAERNITGAVLHEDPVLTANARAIADFALGRRLPMCGFPEFAAAGGLMAYGINFPELEIRAAVFVDKILKGAAPGDLPIQRATNFKLTINLKTAKAIGVNLPTSLLVRADDVIE